MPRVFLIRYGEIALKGQNRPFFLRRLARNIEEILPPPGGRARERFGRVVVEAAGDPEETLARLRRVFGVVGVIPAERILYVTVDGTLPQQRLPERFVLPEVTAVEHGDDPWWRTIVDVLPLP